MRQAVTYFKSLLDFFFPPICIICSAKLRDDEQVLCDNCRLDIIEIKEPSCPFCGKQFKGQVKRKVVSRCPHCPKPKAYFDRARAAVIYNDTAAELVHRLKYQKHRQVVPLISHRLLLMIDQHLREEQFDGLVPVPLHPARQRERGFNQAELIASHMAQYLSLPVWPDVIRRAKPTASQTDVAPQLRAKNVADAFKVINAEQIEGKAIMLIDDVYTSGNTLNECARMLKQAGADWIIAVTFARA